MEYYYCITLKEIKERETPQELGRIAQDIVAIDLKLCNHKIVEYNPVGRSDIETEFNGRRYVFEVKSGRFEIDLTNVKNRIKSRIGEKKLVFFDFSFPARLYVLSLMELPDFLSFLIIPCSRKYEDKELSEIMNKKLPEAIEKYYEFWKKGGPTVAREFVEDYIKD